MKKYYDPCPVTGGIPGIMPGIGSLLPDPIEVENENFIPKSITNSHVCSGVEIPVCKRRMMPCNKVEK